MTTACSDTATASSLRMGVVCEHAHLSHDSKLSVEGIFDHILVPHLPISHPRLWVALVLDRARSDDTVSLDLRTPCGCSVLEEDGEPGLMFQLTVPDAAAARSHNLAVELTGLPLERAGRYEIVVSLNDCPVGTIPLTVMTLADLDPRGTPRPVAAEHAATVLAPAQPAQVTGVDMRSFSTDEPLWVCETEYHSPWQPAAPVGYADAFGGTVAHVYLAPAEGGTAARGG
jgi:hypothetical protein